MAASRSPGALRKLGRKDFRLPLVVATGFPPYRDCAAPHPSSVSPEPSIGQNKRRCDCLEQSPYLPRGAARTCYDSSIPSRGATPSFFLSFISN